MCLGSCNS